MIENKSVKENDHMSSDLVGVGSRKCSSEETNSRMGDFVMQQLVI